MITYYLVVIVSTSLSRLITFRIILELLFRISRIPVIICIEKLLADLLVKLLNPEVNVMRFKISEVSSLSSSAWEDVT